jgi:hypothetical protein
LNLAKIADQNIIPDVDILTQYALPADSCSDLDMAEMPDL